MVDGIEEKKTAKARGITVANLDAAVKFLGIAPEDKPGYGFDHQNDTNHTSPSE